MMSAKGKPTPKKGISKFKDRNKSSSSKVKIEPPETSKDSSLTYPVIKISENERMLPRYSAIMRRSEDQGVGMDDLDTLQLELESLLSTVALRTRAMQDEIHALTTAEGRQDKKGKVSPLVPGKRLKSQERIVKKFKDSAGKVVGESYPSPTSSKGVKMKTVPSGGARSIEISEPEITDPLPQEASKVVVPKNDAPNKFWTYVDPYCAEITAEDIKLLEALLLENDETDYFDIPPLGRHYTTRCSTDESLDEKPMRSEFSSKKMEKDNDVVNTGPLTQRLFSALMEENIVPSNTIHKGDENRIPQLFKSFSVNNSASFERQVRKELEEQGILDPEEMAKDEENDDILQELKRCQAELEHTTAYNVQHLKRLVKLANKELGRQFLKDKLQKADNEIIKIHQKLQIAKKKNEIISKKDQDVCWKALKDREQLLNMIDSM